MNSEILCVGTELLLGDVVNTNATFLAQELAQMGISVYRHSVVGDNVERLKESLKLAFERADIVIMTGGLGPTCDDLTKETVAEYFGRNMVDHPECIAELKRYFEQNHLPMTPNNLKQGRMPEGAIIFKNNWGTAPGVAVEGDGKIAIMLPGPPREMKPMFKNGVQPFLAPLSGGTISSKTVHIFGIGESKAEDMLRDLMQGDNPSVAPYAKDSEVQIRITARAKTKEEADALILPKLEQVCERVGEYVYGVDVGTLENALIQKLKEAKKTIAIAESCTGGYVSKRITDIDGSSNVFGCGIVAYSNDIKEKVLNVSNDTLEKYGAVSAEVASEMAEGVRKLSGADIGISTTGVAGPDTTKPSGLVFIGISTAEGVRTVELSLGRTHADARDVIRYAAASNALSLALKSLS